MSYTAVRLRLPDGSLVLLPPGAILGRSSRADLHVEDNSVSALHAAVELRHGGYRLVALRGSVRSGGMALDALPLTRGEVFWLGSFGPITVDEVVLPNHVFAIASDDWSAELLPPECSLRAAGLRLHEGAVPGAAVVFEIRDGEWWARWEDGEIALHVGGHLHAGGVRLEVVAWEVASVVLAPTLRPDQMRWRFRIERDLLSARAGRGEPVVCRGRLARLVWAVDTYGPDTQDKLSDAVFDGVLPHHARDSWYKALDDLRKWLARAGAPADLVVTTHRRWQVNPAYLPLIERG